ncbi:MAG TPA: peptidoglycan-binding domain-containing protein [Candidatus Angelobacter sp.]|nr:peptidoglycan-binding domain-containing protein [Candidatus Angelobacter sp.]
MPQLSYRQSGFTLQQGANGQPVRDLQHDLRSIGYLRAGINGRFGAETTLAVKALQHDLLTNQGASTGTDGSAPVKLIDYNGGRVAAVNAQLDEPLAACISDILDDAAFPKLPHADDPVQENQRIAQQIAGMSSEDVPVPFLCAILEQESGMKHFREPKGTDEDNFIVVGLDRNAQGEARKYAITSRGYGAGQYTLFHHPPTADEVQQIMLDATKNVLMAIDEFKGKFLHFVVSNKSGADDRLIEVGNGSLRMCKYASDDPRYMKDCKTCALAAGSQPIVPGTTPFYAGSSGAYKTTQYYNPAPVNTMPVRKNLGCDWPYAARRYNGSGVNSYWYQALVLNHLVGR